MFISSILQKKKKYITGFASCNFSKQEKKCFKNTHPRFAYCNSITNIGSNPSLSSQMSSSQECDFLSSLPKFGKGWIHYFPTKTFDEKMPIIRHFPKKMQICTNTKAHQTTHISIQFQLVICFNNSTSLHSKRKKQQNKTGLKSE